MKMNTRLVFAFAIASAFVFEPVIPLPSAGWQTGSDAFAKVGRPATPGSVAGVSRRSSRRTTRRAAYRNSVSGCTRHNKYYNCGGVYYAPSVQDGKTVYVVVNP